MNRASSIMPRDVMPCSRNSSLPLDVKLWVEWKRKRVLLLLGICAACMNSLFECMPSGISKEVFCY